MDYFVPSLLNDLVGEAEQDAHAVFDLLEKTPDGGTLDPGALVLHDAASRTKKEGDRSGRMALMLETLTDKYDNAVRTTALMDEIAAKRRGFVLFLRGFSLKQTFSAEASMGYEADFGEYRARFELAEAIAPTALVIVRNPAASESLLGQFAGAQKAAPSTFAVDLDDSWEQVVESLIRTASFIVVRNAIPGAGLDAELGLLEKCGRLKDTFFSNPESLTGGIASGGPATLDDRALARMRSAAPHDGGAAVALPATPTCLWIQGERRDRIASYAFFVFDYLNGLASRAQGFPRDLQARLLFWTIAASLVLERLDFFIMALSSYAQVLGQFRPDELPDPAHMLQNYGAVLESLATSIDEAGEGARVLDYRDFAHMRSTIGASEDPAALIRATMRVVQRFDARPRLRGPAA
jgi:hypothetical protein